MTDDFLWLPVSQWTIRLSRSGYGLAAYEVFRPLVLYVLFCYTSRIREWLVARGDSMSKSNQSNSSDGDVRAERG
jgi:hypothetical protein